MFKLIYFWISLVIGRIVIWGLKITGQGEGSALPGLVVERINPGFLAYALDSLKHQPVVVSGTNGKTTTTKLLTEIFRSQGKKVFTNPSGSNFTRGIVSELVKDLELFQPVAQQFDMSVLELDEAHARLFAETLDIGTLLILNISRDQLDRFGEVDATRKLLEQVAKSSETVVLNQLEPSTPDMAKTFTDQGKKVEFFGATTKVAEKVIIESATEKTQKLPEDLPVLATLTTAEPTSRDGLKMQIKFPENKVLDLELPKLQGLYNALNFTAALATAQAVLGKLDLSHIEKSVDKFRPAWGRSQIFQLDKQQIHLILVKNPSGYNHALREFGKDPEAVAIFGLNDNYADGRDVSWIWDVDFSETEFGQFYATGSRAYDMALRLFYADLPIAPERVDPDWRTAIDHLLADKKTDKIKFFATYTVMTEVYKYLRSKEAQS